MATQDLLSTHESASGAGEEPEPVLKDDDSSSSSGPPDIPSTVAGNFRIKEKIGSGSYSVVHRGVERGTSDEVAVKFEWVNAEKGRRLLAEAKLYETFGRAPDVPHVRWYGKQGPYNVMVMDLEGSSLDDLFTQCGRKLSLRTVLLLAEQMIERIEFVHSQGILHRDIKPHNFVMGMGDESDLVKVMDFGLAKRFLDRSGKHITCTERKGITGTVRYASLNVHDGLEPSRRDDLEAIGFVLLHFLRGSLPWQGLKGSSRHSKHEKIRRCKQKTSFEELCKGFPNEFVCYFKHVRSLQFTERPDYRYLRKLMRDAFDKQGFKRGGSFDWSEVGDDSLSTEASTMDLLGTMAAVEGGKADEQSGDAKKRRRQERRSEKSREREERDRRREERREERRRRPSRTGERDTKATDGAAKCELSKCCRVRRIHDKSPDREKPRKKSN